MTITRGALLQIVIIAAVCAGMGLVDVQPAEADRWHQQWIGTAPFCGAKPSDCRKRGMQYVRRHKRGNGKKCASGWKVLCRKLIRTPAPPPPPPPGARYKHVWVGTAPFCGGSPRDCRKRGMQYVRRHKRGNGKRCTSGWKVLCRKLIRKKRPLAPAPKGFHYRYEWIGTAPFCGAKASDCRRRRMQFVRKHKRGNGKRCTSGWKVQCRKLMRNAPITAGKSKYLWIGTAPFCGGKASDCAKRGMRFVKYDRRGDGKACSSGRKVLCVTDARIQRTKWVGTAPVCGGRRSDCESRDMDYLRSSRTGDGALCTSGKKVLCRERPMPKRDARGDAANKLFVLNWNIFARPYLVSHDAQRERLAHIPRAIAGINRGKVDVIVFEEAFLTGVERRQLLRNLRRAGFPHATNVTTKVGKLTNGGVFIASRWPIVRKAHHVYKNCTGSDCLAAKGVVYARVRKRIGRMSRDYHVFGTHMQAWPGAKESRLRVLQARELARFVASRRVGRQAAIIAGDLNANLIGQRRHANAVLRAFGGILPRRVGRYQYTAHPSSNPLVGISGGADKCSKQYERRGTCPCCPNEFLDYVVPSGRHLRPLRSTYQILRPKARPFPACMSAKVQPHHVEPFSPFCKKTKSVRDLSDHYPVLGSFFYR